MILRTLLILATLPTLAQGPLPTPQGPANGRVSEGPAGPQGPALDLTRDRGAHPQAARERWSLKGVLRDPAGHRHAFQVVFSLRRLPGSTPGGGWSRQAVLTARAALVQDGGRALEDQRRARLGIPARAAEDHLDLRCEGWSLRDPGDGHFHLDLPMAGGRLQLDLGPRRDPLSLPDSAPADGRRRTLRWQPEVKGRLELPGQVPRSLTGRAALLQTWGPEPTAEEQGWEGGCFFMADGRLIVHESLRSGASLLAEVDATGKLLRIQHPGPSKPRRTWVSPFSAASYPVAVQIQDPRQPLTFEPMLDRQEWMGRGVGAMTMWAGFGTVKDLRGFPAGEGFLELVGFAHPATGRD